MIATNPDFRIMTIDGTAKEALEKSSVTDYTVKLSAQLSNYDSVFSMPATGIAIVHPTTKTADLFFSAVVESSPTSRPKVYDYLSLKTFCDQLGCAGLGIDGYTTIVTLSNNTTDILTYGRTGLKYNPYNGSNTTGGIGRCYQPDLSIVGTWGLSDGDPNYMVIRYGDVYTFTIIGAKMLS